MPAPQRQVQVVALPGIKPGGSGSFGSGCSPGSEPACQGGSSWRRSSAVGFASELPLMLACPVSCLAERRRKPGTRGPGIAQKGYAIWPERGLSNSVKKRRLAY